MAQTELKTIPVNQILANFSQPREKFDRDSIKELSESILGNGLINPITVRKWKDKYMIVSGERRWQAHKFAKLKNIQAFVKEYQDDIAWKIESLVENLQREDLTSIEREKFVYEIWKTGVFKTKNDLAKKIGYRLDSKRGSFINDLIEAKEERDKLASAGIRTQHSNTEIIKKAKTLDDKSKKEIYSKIEKGELIPQRAKEIIPIIKKSSEGVKRALLKDEISIKQAENLGRIHSERAREKALESMKRYEHIKEITPRLMERAKPELTDAVKRQFDTLQRRIFTYLNDAKTSLSKVDNNLKQANIMLSQLMNKSFEYGLDKRTLITTIQQMKSISDRISEFEIQSDRFDKLKETFLERTEDRLKELK